ncbi:hypothetical protein BQ8482_290118 [Mesorhizobium delmotii]|uniref:Uncharacterized protein n=1 Tax=Mesorhizobium delmotii TaxID=1631247 RepID=A0A2P9AMZ6_9HYPH|nr:hypothetical protein BQ8482_290118 [Mesorhizobium delmotii]
MTKELANEYKSSSVEPYGVCCGGSFGIVVGSGENAAWPRLTANR